MSKSKATAILDPATSDPMKKAGDATTWLDHKHSRRILALNVAATILLVVLTPFILGGANLAMMTTVVILGLFAASALVLFGWVGLGSFGQAAFFGAGAYAAALLKDAGFNPLLVLLIGAVAGGAIGLVVALVAGRSTGRQFAMLTLVLGQILFQLTFTLRDQLHGDDGIFGVTPGHIFGLDLSGAANLWWYCSGIAAIGVALLYAIHRSHLGKTMTAVRDDPLKTAALGASVRVTRTIAFMISGFFGAAAGVLYAGQQSGVSPELLSTAMSGSVIFMVYLGGTSSIWGSFVGALVYTVLTTRLFHGSGTGELWIGLLLLGVVMGMRGGVVGALQRLAGKIRTRGKA